MPEMDPRQAEMDKLLRRSLSAPPPRPSPDFHQTLSRRLRRKSRPHPFGRFLLVGYGAISLAVSIVVMRAQGLGWTPIAVTTLGSLATLVVARRLQAEPTRVPRAA